MKDSSTPTTVLKVIKTTTAKAIIDDIKVLKDCFKIVVLIDENKNNLNYPYMIVWRVVNNIDSQKDIYIVDGVVYIDGTNKTEADGLTRQWPDDVECSSDVLDSLQKRALINIDEKFKNEFAL